MTRVTVPLRTHESHGKKKGWGTSAMEMCRFVLSRPAYTYIVNNCILRPLLSSVPFCCNYTTTHYVLALTSVVYFVVFGSVFGKFLHSHITPTSSPPQFGQFYVITTWSFSPRSSTTKVPLFHEKRSFIGCRCFCVVHCQTYSILLKSPLNSKSHYPCL